MADHEYRALIARTKRMIRLAREVIDAEIRPAEAFKPGKVRPKIDRTEFVTVPELMEDKP